VALIFGPLIIYFSYLGGNWLLGMILLFALIGSIEYMIGSGIKLCSAEFWITLLFTIEIIYVASMISFDFAFMTLAVYFILNGIIFAIRNEPPSELFNRQSRLVWVVAYLGLLYPFIFHIRTLAENGGDWLLFLFGTLWLSDTLAMFVGKAFGKRKLAPTVSPNKTIAGFVGGLFGGVIAALIMAYWRLSDQTILSLIGAGILVSIVGQLGDLVESCWKRAIGIKDSSAIIPGHGGVLDRFDSLLFASPVLYLYLRFVLYL
jgi:phosphatidate cytidylyltransferase